MRVFLLFSHCFRRFFHMSNLDVSLNTKKNERIQQQHTLEGRNTHVCSGTLCLLAVAQEFWIILYKINAIVDTYISTFVENTNEKVKRWTKKYDEEALRPLKERWTMRAECTVQDSTQILQIVVIGRCICAATSTQTPNTEHQPQVQIHKCDA